MFRRKPAIRLRTPHTGDAGPKKRKRKTLARPRTFVPRFSFSPGRFFALLFRTVYYGAALSALGLIGYQLQHFLFESDYFQLRSVELSGAQGKLRDEALALGGFKAGEPLNLLELHSRRIAEQIREHPRIKTATVSKIYPDQMRITVEERKPVAIVACKDLFLIDAERVVLAKLEPGELAGKDFPFISGIASADITLGQPVEAAGLAEVLETIQYLQKVDVPLAAQFSEFALNADREVTAALLDGLEVRFGRHHPLAKMPELELFLKRRESIRNVKYVDLRFSNQIVYLPENI